MLVGESIPLIQLLSLPGRAEHALTRRSRDQAVLDVVGHVQQHPARLDRGYDGSERALLCRVEIEAV